MLRNADVGHRIHVEVTVRAPHWVPLTRRSVATAQVRTVPVLHVAPRSGTAASSSGSTSSPPASPQRPRAQPGRCVTSALGRFTVVDGRGSRLLAPMRPGTHPIIVIYRGGAMETPGRITVPVTVP